jgi:nucleoside-diphosphate-sugar epimerase
MTRKIDAYSKSKLRAEKSAWEFQKSLPENERFELVVINPGLVFGPALVPAGFDSGKILIDILEGSVPGTIRCKTPVVDVREVAQAHLNAAKIPEAANQRFILASSSIWYREIGQFVNEEFGH